MYKWWWFISWSLTTVPLPMIQSDIKGYNYFEYHSLTTWQVVGIIIVSNIHMVYKCMDGGGTGRVSIYIWGPSNYKS